MTRRAFLRSKWYEAVGLSEELQTLWEKATVLMCTFIACIVRMVCSVK
jgi:hypothetical protein